MLSLQNFECVCVCAVLASCCLLLPLVSSASEGFNLVIFAHGTMRDMVVDGLNSKRQRLTLHKPASFHRMTAVWTSPMRSALSKMHPRSAEPIICIHITYVYIYIYQKSSKHPAFVLLR